MAFCPSLHLAIGLFVLFGDAEHFDGEPVSAEDRLIFGLMFTIMPLVFMILGWMLGGIQIAAGRCLHRQRRWMFCMVAAALACLFVPLGTVLGVFTIIVLNRETVRTRFGRAATASITPAPRGGAEPDHA